MHFTKYPPNPAYSEFNLEKILIANSLEKNRETKTIGCKGKWYIRLPRLFKDKYNYLPAYFVPMTLPLTLRPGCPIESTTTAKTTSTQLFGVLYITFTGLVDSMVPNSRPWSLFRQSLSYIIKLAAILWWALPTGPAVSCPESPSASIYAWLSETPDDLCVGVVLPKVLGKNGQGVVGQSVGDCKVTLTFSPGSSNIPVLD
ncbi:hypothetical protein DSO57_1004217 [Entomophthora muscae]|uniref:Uncharacterized protein n=1 Tax=Entomophthora muscae TaxID=34485 RepID=A0ACC2RN00_9FUNG|nr:hypothetical protein DSO57_1004217 [Entomophthora muscae]